METKNKMMVPIVVGMMLLLTVLSFSGCLKNPYYSNNLEVHTTGSVLYINETSEPLNLWCIGDGNQFYIHRNVAISHISLNSNSSICWVSTYHGNQTVLNGLIDGKWGYYDV